MPRLPKDKMPAKKAKTLTWREHDSWPWLWWAKFSFDPVLKEYVKGIAYDPDADKPSGFNWDTKEWLVSWEMRGLVEQEAIRCGFEIT